ncbi:hypothetical protein BHAOGJBA_4294 [Methylobacterium hispanicum]|uniref:Uncharacterized protein n=1 Tax=Methylobacterium hispanicum TaxID=270350 RepID=A0AAV4ZRD3_9HYPH|nr:hypothetical protein [Methylobacterium hispanicum]GJD90752.1 hypothetical protein BHAOGJBA_4294 [Methylobacterium hispanicum]
MTGDIRFFDQDTTVAYIAKDAETAEDRCPVSSYMIDAYEEDNPKPFSFRAYDLSAAEAIRLLDFYNQMRAA